VLPVLRLRERFADQGATFAIKGVPDHL